ncbi:MAG: discoidin domain-containing protein [Candidatus Omnitrophica bacterium]|nr:discoidin domain-containing protein [Candidatus Omnitrophota bacterium]
MRKRMAAIFLLFFLVSAVNTRAAEGVELTPPKLTNNPSLDVIVTNTRPLLSFFNSSGGEGERVYTIQLDTLATFDSVSLIEYTNVPEKLWGRDDKHDVTQKLVESENPLEDKTQYHWRVRATDAAGKKSSWAKSRFYLDTSADDSFMNMTRIPIMRLKVSSGENPKNIVDYDDPGQVTFWQATPPGNEHEWVKFDLGETREVSRIWMLTNPENADGWLKDFVWQMSEDSETWTDIEGASIQNNDTFRNIINFNAVKTRYLRLYIKEWHGIAAKINVVTFYSPGLPPPPVVPDGEYVLLVGNQMNGFTFSALGDFVESLDLGLATLTVPHYEVSMEMLNSLPRKPAAIILSGNNANYPNLPMFEYNGEYEIIRESDIPILGICCGHQQLAMAYGYTYARSMGWEDISSMEKPKDLSQIKKMKDDPIFRGMKDPFTAVEIHGWAVAFIPDDFELLALSDYVQAIKHRSRMIYGEQFHAEIKASYNEGTPYLVNFLKMALERERT